MEKILIYSNCHGGRLHQMFDTHPSTKNRFSVSYISNYEELRNETLSPVHLQMIRDCDFFIYQPFNKTYENTEYDINSIRRHLKPSCVVFRINYYRFKGFWYESSVKPYAAHGYYKFLDGPVDFGLHNSFASADTKMSKSEVRRKIDEIVLDELSFAGYFQEELEKFKDLDAKSDVKMYDFFIENYQTVPLFHDCFHPNSRFFYEVFRQTVDTLFQISIPAIDDIFVKEIYELTTWAQPILPAIKKQLGLTAIPDKFHWFDTCYGTKILLLDVYDYYYIRLSPRNLDEHLSNIEKNCPN
jgi:hypothetical protein